MSRTSLRLAVCLAITLVAASACSDSTDPGTKPQPRYTLRFFNGVQLPTLATNVDGAQWLLVADTLELSDGGRADVRRAYTIVDPITGNTQVSTSHSILKWSLHGPGLRLECATTTNCDTSGPYTGEIDGSALTLHRGTDTFGYVVSR